MNLVDPRPAHIGQGFNVHIACQNFRLEAPHLAAGRSLSFDGLATNNPPHSGITSQTLSVVHVFITANASKQRLAELTRHTVPSILAGTAVVENTSGNLSQAKGIVKFPIGKQPGVRGYLIPASGGGQNRPANGTRCFHPQGDMDCVAYDLCTALILISESAEKILKLMIHLGNGGLIVSACAHRLHVLNSPNSGIVLLWLRFGGATFPPKHNCAFPGPTLA